MRSARSLATWIAASVALAACGDDVDRTCASTDLTYETFGAAFVTSWCRGCHSRDQMMRQGAPEGVDLDTRADVARLAGAIRALAGAGRAMPPAGGPSAEERALLVEWLDCGAP
jgi:uncharacterized membrane protein